MVSKHIWHVIQLGKIRRRGDPCVRITQISHPLSPFHGVLCPS